MNKFTFLMFVGSLCTATPLFAETLTNSAVVDLINAGLGSETVVAKIEASDADFKIDTSDLISLKNKGVPSAVIASMVQAAVRHSEKSAKLSADAGDPMLPHFAGIYMLNTFSSAPKMDKIDATITSQTKTGGIIGYALTGGIASASLKAVIQGETAKQQTSNAKPTFYAFFDSSNQVAGTVQTGAFSSGGDISVQSPNEFSLVQLKAKNGRREARFGSFNIAGAKTGVMDKDRIPFSYKQIRTGVYEIVPNIDLKPGEYGFLYAITGGAGPGAMSAGTATARVFGFSVR